MEENHEQKVDPSKVIPVDLMIELFDYLDLNSLTTCLAVSRKWRNIANRSCLWLKHGMKFYPDLQPRLKAAVVNDTKLRVKMARHVPHKYNLRKLPHRKPTRPIFERLSYTAQEIFRQQRLSQRLMRQIKSDKSPLPRYLARSENNDGYYYSSSEEDWTSDEGNDNES